MAKTWTVEADVESQASRRSPRRSRNVVAYSPVGHPFQQWPKQKRTNVIVTVIVIAICVAIALYFILREKGPPKRPVVDGLFPPDPETPLPASWSKLRFFKRGAVCTDGPLCSSIGKDILDQNGSAVDAAIAAMVCNGIINIQSMGFGGGFLMTIYNSETKAAYSLNAREVAPLAIRDDMFKAPNSSTVGPLAIGVPGELRGYWEAHKKFGKLPWKSLFEPTIKLCETGFNMTKTLSDTIYELPHIVKQTKNLREMFYDEQNQKLKPRYSRVMPSKAMCKTLRMVADSDGNALYNGSLSEAFINDLKALGSIITKEDLEKYRPRWNNPVKVPISEKDTMISVPPPGSGALLGYIMNILRYYKFNGDSTKDLNSTILTYHRIIEAFKYAYAKRTLLGDADFVNVADLIKNLTSAEFAENTSKKIDDTKTNNNPAHYGAEFFNQPDHGTAHVSILAANGDAVSVTGTINYYFGSGLESESTGIVLNNGLDDFSITGITNMFNLPGSPANAIEPAKAAMSSMSPSIITDENGDVKMVIGASGGTKITTSISLVIMRILMFEQTIKEAVDAPRIHHQIYPMQIEYEYGTLAQVVEGLRSLGHNATRYSGRGSIVCAIYRNETGIYANADYRKGGDVFGID